MDDRQIQPREPDQVVLYSEVEKHLWKVAIFFVGAVPLMALSQVLGFGIAGLIIGAVVIAVIAATGKSGLAVLTHIPGANRLIVMIPEIHWNRLIGAPDSVNETEPANVIDADPPRTEAETSESNEAQDTQSNTPEATGQDDTQTGAETHTQEEPEADVDTILQQKQQAVSSITLPRLSPNDIIRHTERNSYQVCIGRSLTRKGNPAIWLNIYRQHLKLIGASQYGKSSMAAAILYIVTRTHDPDKVLVVLLDLEHKTSRLFADIPHLARVSLGGQIINLHAKTKEQVLEYLGYVVMIVEERYKLTEEEVEQEPLLLVYLEEFLDLKDHFKVLKDKTDYDQLVYRVNRIARRGLKVKVQLLMCAQVDYRDEDFREALVNVSSGMSFCVATTAAQAAGFKQADLLRKNVELNEQGTAVVETRGIKDLVHALDFDLRKMLRALAKKQGAQTARSGMLTATGTQTDTQPAEQTVQEPLAKTNPYSEELCAQEAAPRRERNTDDLTKYPQPLESDPPQKQTKEERIINWAADLIISEEATTQAAIAQVIGEKIRGVTTWTIRQYWQKINDEVKRREKEEE